MKYLLGLAVLSIGTFAQNSLDLIESKDLVEHLSVDMVAQPSVQKTIFKDPLVNQPEIKSDWAMVDDGKYYKAPSSQPQMPGNRRQDHQRNHQRKQHHVEYLSDHKIASDPIERAGQDPIDYDSPPIEIPQQQLGPKFLDGQPQKDDHDIRHHKRFWKGKKVGHIFFFVILGIISIFLVKKCIKKRQGRIDRRRNQIQNLTDPAMIDQEIQRHYAQIQRLTDLRNNLQKQVDVEPIIYHQTYSQEMEMSNASRGRMVNQNSYPINDPQQVPYQKIPVGRPVIFSSPYNHPQIYRANQY